MTEHDRRNNFDALRLIAALTVMVGHAWALTGVPRAPLLGGHLIHHDAVYVFFAISGYLIASSWARSPHPLRFLRNRVLRIVPALAVVVLVTVFVIGPLVTTDAGYFGRPATWSYLGNIGMVAQYRLPGVFESNPTTSVNGALWTLGAEFACYLGVLAVGLLARRRAPLVFAVLIVPLIALSLMPGALPKGLPAVATAMVFFAGGAALTAPGLARFVRPIPAVALLVVWAVAGVLWGEAGKAIAWLAVPYAVVALGTRSTPVLRDAGRFGDFSYGLYLWGFPLQQLVVLMLGPLPIWLDLLIVVPLTLAAAMLSWHLVERRALALKFPRPAPQGTARTSAAPGNAAV